MGRLLAVQSFSHRFCRPCRDRDVSGEPLAKAARQDSSTSECLPPWSSFWTPSPKAGCGGVSASATDAEKALFDPYAMHRFYCPFYSRVDDDVGSFAARVISSHMAASNAAATATSADSKQSQAAGEQAVGFAAARAEELLRALGAILPP